MTAITGATVKADGIDIRTLQAGTGEPLVYLHGAGGLKLSTAHRALAQNHRLTALELPGFGNTPATASHTSARAIAATVAKALDALDISRCALMGHSLGANIALWMAIDRPTLASSLVLVAPTAIRPDTRAAVPAAAPSSSRAHDPANLWFSEPTSPELQTAMRELARKLSGPPRDAVLENAMRELAIPVLTLFGTRGTIVSPDAAREYCALMPKCFATLVYDAGHDIDVDRPDAVAEVVKSFLQYGESFIVNRDDGMIHA